MVLLIEVLEGLGGLFVLGVVALDAGEGLSK